MKYALIGCGSISPNHIEAAKNNYLEFVVMCDITLEVIQKNQSLSYKRGRRYCFENS